MSPAAQENLALFLAARQKRLAYWRQAFGLLERERMRDVPQHLSTYALLLAKLAKQTSEAERAETQQHLLALERQLTTIFEQYCLAASDWSPRELGATPLMKPRGHGRSA